MNGCSPPGSPTSSRGWTVGRRASTTTSSHEARSASAQPSWAATCSGPIRGPWENEQWTGWWGDNPPYHYPVFVLTHHPRPPVTMEGGTTFHFVTDGINAALDRAFAAAGGQDVRLYGGAATVQQYLRAGLIDDLELAIAPVLLSGGERLFDHLDGGPQGYECAELVSSPAATHVRLVRTA
jgi:dihydrofolate reductase